MSIIMNGYRGSGAICPTEAVAFNTTAGITDPAQQEAVCQLVRDLKGIGSTTNNTDVFSKLSMFYPMVGGNASKHSYNLVNPATYQITWQGGTLHSANGVIGTSVNGAGNASIYANDVSLSQAIGYSSWISLDGTPSTGALMGGRRLTSDSIQIAFDSTTTFYVCGQHLTDRTDYTHGGSTKGLWLAQRDGVNSSKLYKNGAQVSAHTDTTFTTYDTSLNLLLVARSNAGANVSDGITWQNSPLSCMGYHEQMTASEIEDYYDSILAFQTALGRN